MPRFVYFVLLLCAVYARAAQTPGNGSPTVSTPNRLFREGHFAEAATLYRSMLERDRLFAAAHAGLVQALLKLDDVASAEEASTNGLITLPQSAPVHAARGDVLFREGRMPEAEAEYRKALQLDETCARAQFGIGRMEAIASHRDHARSAFERAHRLDPEDGDVLYRWAVLLPWPRNIAELEKHLTQFHTGPERERREREYVAFLKALGGRSIWTPPAGLRSAEIKLVNVATHGALRGAGIRVSLNGGPRHTLLLDTGVSWITISRKLAEKSGARKLSDFGFEGTGDAGPGAGYYAWVDKISIGGLEFHDCVIQVMMKESAVPEEGTVGLQMFTTYQISLDLKAHRLHLSSLPPEAIETKNTHEKPLIAENLESAQPRQFLSFGHLMLVNTRVNGKQDGLFVFDTGANATSISARLARQVARRVRSSNQRITGSSGDVRDVFVAEDVSLDFGVKPGPGEDLPSYDMPALSSNLETEISGLIGFQSLARKKITINYRDGLLKVEP